MTGWPPAELREAARQLVLECPDCAGVVTVHWSERKGRWVFNVRSRETCPTRRTARSRRAAERDLIDMAAARLHLAQYAADGELVTMRHRVMA